MAQKWIADDDGVRGLIGGRAGAHRTAARAGSIPSSRCGRS